MSKLSNRLMKTSPIVILAGVLRPGDSGQLRDHAAVRL